MIKARLCCCECNHKTNVEISDDFYTCEKCGISIARSKAHRDYSRLTESKHDADSVEESLTEAERLLEDAKELLEIRSGNSGDSSINFNRACMLFDEIPRWLQAYEAYKKEPGVTKND